MIFRLPASILLLTVFLAQAQPASNAERSTEVSHATMRSILRDMRLEFTETPSGDSAAFDLQLNGHKVRMLSEIKDMKLSSCFDSGVAFLKMNPWNQEHFFTAASLDESGCPSLRADVGFAGGVTKAMIEEWIGDFSTAVTVFARFVAEPPPGDTGVQPTADRPTSPIGTMAWSQPRAGATDTPPLPGPAESVPGLLRIDPNTTLKFNPDKWKQTPSHEAGQFALLHSSGDGHALVIAEPVAVPLDSIQDVALENARLADPDAKMVFREKRKINGVVLWVLKIEAKTGTVPMVYWGYYYAGQNGTVQVVTYTTKTLLPGSESDFMELLNGLVVSVPGN